VESVKAAESSKYSVPDKGPRIPKKVLNKEDFLSLLVAQLKNQNPLEPQSNEEFISTMAQFNSLETLTSLDKSINYGQAMSMMDKPVTVQELNKDPIVGKVEKAGLVDGKVVVFVGGQKYSISDVKEIHPQEEGQQAVSGSELAQAALMIGKEVLLAKDNISGVVEKVGLVDGKIKIYVNGTPYDISGISEIKNPASLTETGSVQGLASGQSQSGAPETEGVNGEGLQQGG